LATKRQHGQVGGATLSREGLKEKAKERCRVSTEQKRKITDSAKRLEITILNYFLKEWFDADMP
jgi:hypothetical protein